MRTLLLGIALGALLPVGLAVLGNFLTRRKQRRLARQYLRRTIGLHSGR